MTSCESWFRPRLDDLGTWQSWELQTAELKLVREALATAADDAAASLRTLFGEIGTSFGADALCKSLAAFPFADERAFALAKAVTVLDYHLYRAKPPRPRPGGLTNEANKKVWQRLRPHLLERLLALIGSDTRQSMVWRAVFERIPERWLPVELIEQALENRLVRLGAYTSIEVDLTLNPPATGGLGWIDGNVRKGADTIEQCLRERRPVLIEIIRDPADSPLDSDLLVVFRAEREESGELHLFCYDARDAGTVRIDVVPGERFRFIDRNLDADIATIKALRVCCIAPARPPLFGARRFLDRLLPWKSFWSLKRRIRLLFERYGQNPDEQPAFRRTESSAG